MEIFRDETDSAIAHKIAKDLNWDLFASSSKCIADSSLAP
jgi:hypothetical protein